jgi:3-oxoacyl-(acyl-carrier-protein) synthase
VTWRHEDGSSSPGQGTINALGADVPATLEAMREGRCGIGPLELRDVERLSIRIGGQVKGYDPRPCSTASRSRFTTGSRNSP